jgi:hypothetical protein
MTAKKEVKKTLVLYKDCPDCEYDKTAGVETQECKLCNCTGKVKVGWLEEE